MVSGVTGLQLLVTSPLVAKSGTRGGQPVTLRVGGGQRMHELVQTQEQIPRAELELHRAQREHDQFRDDARRQGVTPGWLR